MKDHIKAEWINRITKTAKTYCNTQQLRSRIGSDVLELISTIEQEQKEKDAILFDEAAECIAHGEVMLIHIFK